MSRLRHPRMNENVAQTSCLPLVRKQAGSLRYFIFGVIFLIRTLVLDSKKPALPQARDSSRMTFYMGEEKIHQTSPNATKIKSITLIPMNGTINPPKP